MKKYLNYLIMLLVLTAVFGGVYASGSELLQVQIRNLDRAALVSLFQMDIDIDGVHGNTARAYIFSDRLDDLRKPGSMISENSDTI